MFKLLRDSIFRPKRIIAYRAKKPWFVILYVLIVSLIVGFSASYKTLFYSKTSYAEKIEIAYEFNGSDAKFNEYNYVSSKNHTITLGDDVILFTPSEAKLEYYLSSSYTDYIVFGDTFYRPVLMGNSYILLKIAKLKDYSELFRNVDLSSITTDSEFFNAIDALIKTNRPIVFMFYFALYLIINLFGWLMITLLSYWFANLFYGAKNYMKKGQLFKMLLFATTSYNIVTAFLYITDFGGIIRFILIAASLIPLMSFEREILLRIRLFQLSKGMIKDEELAKKLQELNDKNKDDKDGD